MCGFLVEIRRGCPIEPVRFERALDTIAHRGPDAAGMEFLTLPARAPDAPALHGALGFRRLAILDLDERANQPFHADGCRLVYNGEIYNFRDLARRAAACGRRFTTTGDTEVLAALLADHGIAGLTDAIGMWAFCRLDPVRGTLLAARDRYGKKPLFWYADTERIVLASEITPILTVLGRQPRLKAEALATYLATGWLYPRADGATHVESIREIVPGGAVSIDLHDWSCTPSRWFDVRRAVETATPDPATLPGLIEDAVMARLVSDRPVALLLSGGIDSSLILSVLAARGRAHQVHTFSGDAGRSEDADYARRSVAALGVTAHFVALDYGPRSLDAFLATCRHQEKPFPFIGNALSAPQLYAAIAAAEVPVVLDGAGADEVFGGYWERTWAFAIAEATDRGDAGWLKEARLHNADRPELIAILNRVSAEMAAGTFGQPGCWPRIVPSSLTDDFRRFAPAFAAPPLGDPLALCGPRLTEALIRDAAPGGRLGEWLWHNDRNAMAASLENRSPFLDHRLLPFMATPMVAKFTGPWNKRELRVLFDRFRPLAVQHRRAKQGFRWHYTPFVRNNRDGLLDLLADSALVGTITDRVALLDWLRHDHDALLGDLAQRLICLAGLERALSMTV